jgi:integration host factor subunit alpha
LSLGKKDIAKNISSKASISQAESINLLKYFLKKISPKINQRIKISNFGVFHRHLTIERVGRNPKTKEEYLIPRKYKVYFKASGMLKKLIN